MAPEGPAAPSRECDGEIEACVCRVRIEPHEAGPGLAETLRGRCRSLRRQFDVGTLLLYAEMSRKDILISSSEGSKPDATWSDASALSRFPDRA